MRRQENSSTLSSKSFSGSSPKISDSIALFCQRATEETHNDRSQNNFIYSITLFSFLWHISIYIYIQSLLVCLGNDWELISNKCKLYLGMTKTRICLLNDYFLILETEKQNRIIDSYSNLTRELLLNISIMMIARQIARPLLRNFRLFSATASLAHEATAATPTKEFVRMLYWFCFHRFI